MRKITKKNHRKQKKLKGYYSYVRWFNSRCYYLTWDNGSYGETIIYIGSSRCQK